MAPIPNTAYLQAATSLFGSGLGALGGGLSNKAYIAGIRETNAANYKMMQEQNQFNLNMWSKNNAYNSPSAQRARLLQAGINGTTAITGGESGQPVQSVAGSPMQAPSQMQNPLSSFSALGSDFVQVLAASKMDADVTEQRLKNYRLGVESRTFEYEHLMKLRSQEYDLLSKQNRSRSEELQLENLRLEIAKAEKNLGWIDKLNQSQLDSTEATTRSVNESIERDNRESAQRIASMKVSDAVNWFNARTGRMSTEQENRESEARIDSIKQQVSAARGREEYERLISKYAAKVKKVEASKSEAELRYAWAELEYLSCQLITAKDLQASFIAKGIRQILGIDANQLFSKIPVLRGR